VFGYYRVLSKRFPYAAYYDSESLDSFQLYDILKEAAEPCPGSDDLICCPDLSYGLPIKKAQYEGQTTEVPVEKPETNTTAEEYRLKENCGANLYQVLKVVGGRLAQPGEFPYAVALLNNGKQFCGGSLISEQWVLTAAHCIANLRSFSKVAVHVGDHDVKKQTEVQHQSRSVKKGLYNKGFSFSNLQHDVALLQLTSPATLSDSVQPVCLSNTPPPFGDKAVLAGWGKTGKHQPPSSTLRTVKMRVIPHEECKAIYAKEPQAPPVTSRMVCAGEGSQGKPELKDACNGDSGGPLVFFDNGKAVQMGIVSWGIGCGDKPGVYTRVDQYRSWIDKNSRRKP